MTAAAAASHSLQIFDRVSLDRLVELGPRTVDTKRRVTHRRTLHPRQQAKNKRSSNGNGIANERG